MRLGRWLHSAVIESYLVHLPPSVVLAAAGFNSKEQPLKQRYFHERFEIEITSDEKEELLKLIYPWLPKLRAAVRAVRKRGGGCLSPSWAGVF